MKTLRAWLPTVARILLGLLFTVFGLNGFFHFLPQPPPPPAAGAFLGALASTGYMFPLIKGTEVIAGLLLLAGRYVPLALTILAPVLVNILAFHLALAPAGVGMALFVIALEVYLAFTHRAAFRPMLQAGGRPIAQRSAQGAQPAGEPA
jgi:uncharacterized membrane protein YphA (DoxX/SURF4 family)